MSYGRDLYNLMTSDTSLNVYFDGGIYFENLPDNFDLTKSWMVYSFRKSSQNNCLNAKNAYTTYQIEAKVVSPDTDTSETISDRLIEYLNGNYEGGIVDIWFTADTHTLDLEKGVYMNSLTFESFYVS